MTKLKIVKQLNIILIALTLGLCLGCRDTLNPQKPNIVFIFIDDLGWKDVGYMGSDYYETPNIDKLAGEGMIFTNAYANAANCAPSRACFLTGQYSPRHGAYTVVLEGNSYRSARPVSALKKTHQKKTKNNQLKGGENT